MMAGVILVLLLPEKIVGEVKEKLMKHTSTEMSIRDRTINIDYDRGEGVGQVKNNLIDILVLKFNKQLDFFIQDSCCCLLYTSQGI